VSGVWRDVDWRSSESSRSQEIPPTANPFFWSLVQPENAGIVVTAQKHVVLWESGQNLPCPVLDQDSDRKPNHHHLLLETPEANLVAGMKWLQDTYTQR